jgi:hypothetical protein
MGAEIFIVAYIYNEGENHTPVQGSLNHYSSVFSTKNWVVNQETERKPTGFCQFCEPCSSWPNASISQVGSEKTMNLLFSILRLCLFLLLSWLFQPKSWEAKNRNKRYTFQLTFETLKSKLLKKWTKSWKAHLELLFRLLVYRNTKYILQKPTTKIK